MRICIIEDEPAAVRRLEQLITQTKPDSQVVARLSSVEASVKWLSENPDPDLIFLDIQLADGLSFSIFQKVKTQAPVIFCTAYDEYALKAFKLKSIDYLLKPIEPEQLMQAFEKYESLLVKTEPINMETLRSLIAQDHLRNFKKRFMVKVGERIHSVNVHEVLYFFSAQKATFLQTKTGKRLMIEFSLEELEQLLDPMDFFRINRKYIINHQAIRDIFTFSNSRLKIYLQSCQDENILISREKVAEFKAWLDG